MKTPFAYFPFNATNLIFAAETNSVGTTYLTAPISWQRCDWNQLVLNYTATNSALYLNGSLISTGWGVTLWPGASVRATGFTVGSDAHGTNQAKGLFEDLEIFNRPLTTKEIAENFQTNRPPNAIANLKMWLKADADAQTNAVGQVHPWLDQTCNGISATQLAPNSRPLLSLNQIDGRPAVRFHTTNFFNLSNFPTNWTEAEAFLVLKAEADDGANRGLWHLEASSGGNVYPSAAGVIGDNFGRAGETVASGNPSLSISQPHIYNVLTKPNEWTSRINGVIHYSTSSNVVGFPSSGAELGRNRFGDSFHGYIAEILFFNRVLNEPERRRVEIYLNQRYTLVTSVPATPTNLVAKAVSPTQVSVSWNAVLGNTNVFFTVERKVVSGEFSAVGSLRNAGSFLDTALQTNTTYVYRVKAANWAGDSTYSPETSVTTATNGADIPVSILKLWLKADSGRGANPIPLWADQSGNGAHASQHIKNRRGMAVQNAIATSKPVIGFFTTNSFYLRSLGHGSWTSAEAYVVLKTRQTNTLNEVWGFGSAGGLWYPHPNGLIYDNFFRSLNANNTTLFPQTSLQAFHLYNPASTSNLWSSRINGAPYASTNNTYENFTLPTLGIAGNSQPWDGDMAELLIFNQPLTTGERTAVENYLNNRYFLW